MGEVMMLVEHRNKRDPFYRAVLRKFAERDDIWFKPLCMRGEPFMLTIEIVDLKNFGQTVELDLTVPTIVKAFSLLRKGAVAGLTKEQHDDLLRAFALADEEMIDSHDASLIVQVGVWREVLIP